MHKKQEKSQSKQAPFRMNCLGGQFTRQLKVDPVELFKRLFEHEVQRDDKELMQVPHEL